MYTLNNYASSEIIYGMDYTHIQRPKINLKLKNFYKTKSVKTYDVSKIYKGIPRDES
jgi:hypothetical protein